MRFLDALRCQNGGRPPVWIMRQAGRYLPSYQALRRKHSLWEMFHHPEIAAEVTLLPVDLLQVDAAILFSDILVIAEVFGQKTIFPETGGPRIEPPITCSRDVVHLQMGNVEERLQHVLATIGLLKPTLSVPLIGFCGGPFTVASYMIEGGGKEGLLKTLSFLQSDPAHFHQLLDKITTASILYLKAQIQAGVQAVQIFDSWANFLSDAQFVEFSIRYLKKIVEQVPAPVILFCRGSSLRPRELAEISPAAISFDWHQELSTLRKIVPSQIAVQGNLHPEILRGSYQEVVDATTHLLKTMHGERGFIANLGHGILPDVPVNNVRAFVDTVRRAQETSTV